MKFFEVIILLFWLLWLLALLGAVMMGGFMVGIKIFL